jgi:transcriptional regulator with XRE-family HTH domain
MEEKTSKAHIGVDFFKNLTGDIDQPETKDVAEIGARISSLRREKNLSLEELSRMTGFDVDFLARIEANEIQPQLGTIIKLSKALDSAFGRLISGVGDRLYSITRINERRTVSRSSSQTGKKHLYSYKSLAPDVKGRHMEALIVQLEESPDRETSIHEGEEFIFVLDGTVRLEIGEDGFDLEPGDSAYYLSTTPHYIAAKSGRATIIAVLYEG